MKKKTFAASLLILLMLGAWGTRADDSLTVVELFTSQGCSSCPPADALLGEIAQLEGVLALSEHVDYWDYLGWKDPFAMPEASARQREYASQFGLSYVYTPQIVIQGSAQVVGFKRGDVLSLIEAASSARSPDVSIERTNDHQVVVSVGDFPGVAEADLLLVLFDDQHTTEIIRGENGGRRLSNYNVVRELRHIGTWTGKALEVPVSMSDASGGTDACAVIVQQRDDRRILAAARLRLVENGANQER